jgi:renalase
MSELDFLVVGAGISGLLAASGLVAAGHRGIVLEKSRGVGGRMATRRLNGEVFDHGAQFMTAREDAFQALIEAWRTEGVVVPWFGQDSDSGHVRFRGAPGMTAVAKHLASGLTVERRVQVASVTRIGRGWRIEALDGQQWKARVLVLSAPVPQSLKLLETGGLNPSTDLDPALSGITYDPCFALMVSTEEGEGLLPQPGWLRPESGPIAWMADNRLKGVSPSNRPALTLHASSEFSRTWFEAEPEAVTTRLLEAARPWVRGRVMAHRLHRWRYSQPVNPLADPVLVESERGLVFCGDAFGGARVEGAALSGLAAAERVRSLLGG